MTQPSASEQREVVRSSRDPEDLKRRLESWLGSRLDTSAGISDLQATSANGMSSETILFSASWEDRGAKRSETLVARIAPDPHDVPVFPSYDMERQARAIRLVGELTSVPVPKVWWSEADPSVLDVPFFVMERIEGEVPPDVMPYNFGDSWLFAAAASDQRRLQDSSVAVLAKLHAIERPTETFEFLECDEPGDTHLRRHVAHTRAWYEYCATGGDRSPLIERAFAWIESNWPSTESDPVVIWGDSRIGNMMFRDFEPVAVLDWEMAALGPRELDVAWMAFAHRAFEDLAGFFEMPGMPDFMRPDDVAATYESLTGYALRDLTFYMTYCALQWAIVFLRTGQRAIHFGEEEKPGDIDELLRNREPLERMLAGTYWEALR
ncbi:MAG: phosphotransferase family protein [Actinomycetota bacterium]